MKILHVSTDTNGGAGIAATRLHHGVAGQGIDSHFLALRAHVSGTNIHQIEEGYFSRKWRQAAQRLEKTIQHLLYHHPEHPAYVSFPLIPSLMHHELNKFSRDIVHLHWVCEDFISPYSLGRLNGPVVWTVHDTWPFTGGCHWVNSCDFYRQSCGHCPELCSLQSYDLSRLHWKLKRAAIARLQPTIVSPSRSYAQLAKQSGMLAGCRIECIPNGIDNNVFRPIEKKIARELLGLTQDRLLILFGALGATSDHNKGFDLLHQALCSLPESQLSRSCAVVFGSACASVEFPCSAHFLGRMHDNVSLALAYSAADIFVCPSRQENLPNTVMESLACGTPVVAFSVGGIPDMVEHQINGYMASPYDTKELAFGISSLLDNAVLREQMGLSGKNKIDRQFSLDIVSRKYVELYADLLEKANNV